MSESQPAAMRTAASLVRIMLADDHRMFCDALRHLLETRPTFKIVAETGDGNDVVRLAQETAPDIVCMDIGMPGANGVEATRRLLAVCPSIKVVAVSTFTEQRYVLDMFEAGAMAYVAKSAAGEELLRAIEAVLDGRRYTCPQISNSMLGVQTADPLSARERQVLKRVAEGYSSLQIAGALNIAHSTVEVHRRNIMRKLDLHSVAELTRYAIDRKLIVD